MADVLNVRLDSDPFAEFDLIADFVPGATPTGTTQASNVSRSATDTIGGVSLDPAKTCDEKAASTRPSSDFLNRTAPPWPDPILEFNTT